MRRFEQRVNQQGNDFGNSPAEVHKGESANHETFECARQGSEHSRLEVSRQAMPGAGLV